MFSLTAGTHVLLEREIVREGMSEMEFPECRAFLWTFSPSDVFPPAIFSARTIFIRTRTDIPTGC